MKIVHNKDFSRLKALPAEHICEKLEQKSYRAENFLEMTFQ